MKYLLILLCFLSTIVFAQETKKDFHFETYKMASKADSFLKFENKSTKFGLLTTSYDGYAKDFTLTYSYKDKTFSGVKVSLKADTLDTDVDARNEKMRDLCLETKNNPEIIVTLSSVVKVSSEEQNVPASILIRGKSKPIELKMIVKENEVSGKARLSFKEMELPDPSIAIAKVKDDIDLQFKILLQ
jgi:polyisoprenoid-binding protein YceI